MTLIKRCYFINAICVFTFFLTISSAFMPCQAADSGYTIDSKGRYVITISDKYSGTHYTKVLNSLLKGSTKRTIVIPGKATINLTSTLHIGSNKTLIVSSNVKIIQTGSKSTGSKCGIMSNVPKKMNYSDVENIVISGGTWLQKSTSGSPSLFRFAHAQNIKIQNAVIKQPYGGHGIEFIACKNCTVSKCSVLGVGKTKTGSVEEAIQIDIAEIHTAPGIKSECGSKFCNGATCRNITIENCKVRGGRGICANYAAKGTSAMQNKFHGYLKITNCTIEGMTAEAVALMNTCSATITGNKMRTKNSDKTTTYSIGLNITIIGKNSSVSKGSLNIQNNKISGCKNGLRIASNLGIKYKFNKNYCYKSATVKNNTVYAKTGSINAIKVTVVNKKTITQNSIKNWKW